MEPIKLDFLPEVLGALAKALKVDEIKDADGLLKAVIKQGEAIKTQINEIETQKATAKERGEKIVELESAEKFGEELRDKMKTELKGLEVKIAGFKGQEPRKSMNRLIDHSDEFEDLENIGQELKGELEKLAPVLKCAECGSTKFTRRVSVQDEPDLQASRDTRRVPDVRGVQI